MSAEPIHYHPAQWGVVPNCLSCGEELVRAWLRWAGEEPDREGLQQTPSRVVSFWRNFLHGAADPSLTAFESVKADQMVLVRGVEVWSLCEHHLLPFRIDLDLAYITRDRVLGLSKFVRLARQAAGKLQLQERLVEQLADALEQATDSPDVAVLGTGLHLCLAMRGVRQEATMVTSALRGAFRSEPEARAEFLRLARDGGR